MSQLRKDIVNVPGGSLAVWSVGNGPPVIFLQGGPGDTHDYMKRMAEPLFNQFLCIFFDQRGTGGSSNFKRDSAEYKVDLLLNDILAVAKHLGAVRPALVGHSWGAMYALFACAKFPDSFSKAALVSMGPLDSSMAHVTSEHLMSAMNDGEKAEWTELRRQRSYARDNGDLPSVVSIDRALMNLRVNAWIFNPDLRAAFLDEYFLDPPPDREVNKWVWSHAEKWFSWDSLASVKSELWICTGANDSVPLAQTKRIAEAVPESSVSMIESCGHIPWFEQPHIYYRDLRGFLNAK